MAVKLPREMTGAELKSMLKSSINLKSLGGVKCPELKLPPEDLQWWRDAKVGMFIHWGLYSILGRGEWARFNEKIPKEEYEGLAEEFIPEDFSMQEWMEIAKDFGAKYTVMVTRHHDGFALWDSRASYEGFTSANHGSHRDFVKEYTDAARAAGMRVGVYYSPMDWRFPGYFDPEGLPENAALMKAQCYGQVEELCSNYGPIDIMWYDGGWLAHKGSDTSSAWFWEPVKLNKIVRSYNPKTLLNPRSGYEGDFYCDEGSHEITGKILPVPWEKNMCVCSGCSWGWMADDPVSDFDWLIRMMVNVICRDGNWLVNIGPDRNGKISREIRDRMHQVGEWLREYGEAVYGTRGGPIEPLDNVYGATSKENKIYLHLLDVKAAQGQWIPLEGYRIESASAFRGEELPFEQREDAFRVDVSTLETAAEEQPDTIVILTLDRAVERQAAAEVYFTGKE